MNELYQKNMAWLLEKKIIPDGFDTLCDSRFVVENAKNGMPTLLKKDETQAFYFHSPYDPGKEAEMFAEKIQLNAEILNVLYGIGLGYHLKELLARKEKNTRLLVVEPEPAILNKAMEYIDFQEIFSDETVIFVLLTDNQKFKKVLSLNYAISYLQNIIMIHTQSYYNNYGDHIRQAIGIIEDAYALKLVERNTVKTHGINWVCNYIHNLMIFPRSTRIEDFVFKFNDIPIIIVSAGPSLDKNVHLLKQVEDKAIILSSYTALRVLRNHQIKVDFAVSIDGKQLIVEDEHEQALPLYAPLIYFPLTDRRLLRKEAEHRILMVPISDEYMLHVNTLLNKEVHAIYMGGSVASSALDLAYYMGGNPIVFIGQDLAIGDDDKTHATGTNFDNRPADLSRVSDFDIYVDGIHGGKVRSNNQFRIYQEWIEDYVKIFNKNHTFIDATEGGALIKGTKVMTLQDTIDKYIQEPTNKREILDAIYKQPFSYSPEDEKVILQDVSQSLEMFDTLVNDLKKFLDQLIIYQNNYASIPQRDKSSLRQLIDDFNDYIETVDKAAPFTHYALLSCKVQAEDEFEEEPVDDLTLLELRKSIRHYQLIIESAVIINKVREETKLNER